MGNDVVAEAVAVFLGIQQVIRQTTHTLLGQQDGEGNPFLLTMNRPAENRQTI